MKPKYIILLSAAVLLYGCTKPEEPVTPEEELTEMKVQLEDTYGSFRAAWNAPEEDCTYEVTLYDQTGTDGETAFRTLTTESTAVLLTDELAWYLQEAGLDSVSHPFDLIVVVTAYKDDRTIASVRSDALTVKDLLPPEEAPVLFEDIAREDITFFEWSSSGSSVDQIFNYSVVFEEGETQYYASYFGKNGQTERELLATDAFREELLDVIGRGTLYRDSVMDPEIEILDGGEEYCRIEWNGMKESERQYYRLRFSEEDEQEMQRLMLDIIN
ncbi:MAG: hypothetical protein IKF51_00695 [Solobacterium sp.]|nr:hypothetical protein [Solobacterium sp.]